MVDQEFRDALTHVRDRVVMAAARHVRSRLANTWYLYSDAACEPAGHGFLAGLGAVLVSSDGTLIRCLGQTFSLEDVAPLCLHDLSNPIYALEGLAVVAALEAWGDLLASSELVDLVDNEGVLGSLVACKSTADYFDPILSMIVSWEEKAVVSPWYERVSSVANIADGPSRNDFSDLVGVPRSSLDVAALVAKVQGQATVTVGCLGRLYSARSSTLCGMHYRPLCGMPLTRRPC